MSEAPRRKIAVVLVDRANYGRMKPVMHALARRPEVDLRVLCAGTMVLERFGLTLQVVRDDGFDVHGEVFMELEGSTPTTMAKSLGIGVVEFANEFRRVAPDLVLLIGDRYEALAAALAAGYMNLTLAHIQGGEVSGSVDESARHAISKFAHYHFPSTPRASEYLARMGEDPATILAVGCPSSDLARSLDRELSEHVLNGRGSGSRLDPSEPFLLVVFHPATTEYGGEAEQVRELLEALRRLKRPTLMLWPNIDAGSNHISKEIRVFRDRVGPAWLRIQTNLEPEDYLRVLANAACAIGNSSSFVRDAGYFGTPVVLVGTRQDGREADVHVARVPPSADRIVATAERQLSHGRYPPTTLYGDGQVAERIAEALVGAPLYVQKRLHYIHDP